MPEIYDSTGPPSLSFSLLGFAAVGLDKVSEEPVKTAAPASPAGNTKEAAGVNKVC